MDEKAKILIVDDEPRNLDFFDVMLDKLGFEVERAENGIIALEMVKKFKPDLILLDNVMPKLSGWQVTRLIKQDPEYSEYKDISIIMFSAMDDVKDKIEGFELGVDDYITKPFNFSEVIARIRAVLKNREIYRQNLVKEHKFDQIQSFSESVLSFLMQLREPLEQILSKSNPDIAMDESTADFCSFVATEAEKAVVSLDEFKEEISRLTESEIDSNENGNFLKELDQRIHKHFVKSEDSDGE
ncbi:MAG: response regulator [Spirochaetaceae bacterium]|nr:response regulator [Spirochaetaceae bacterium]